MPESAPIITAGAPISPALTAASPSTIAPTSDREIPTADGMRRFASRKMSKIMMTNIISAKGLKGIASVALSIVNKNLRGIIW